MKVPFQSLLCPTDLSKIGDLAVPVAYRLAGNNATVHMLHVCEPPFLGNPLYGQFVDGYVPTPEELELAESRARKHMHELPPDSETERGIRTEYHLIHGVGVADVIEEEAKRLGVEVVVMGTRGRTGLGRLVMGSVATEVVGKDELQVILVHQDLDER